MNGIPRRDTDGAAETEKTKGRRNLFHPEAISSREPVQPASSFNFCWVVSIADKKSSQDSATCYL
jgi:hypothetical protein